MRDRLKDEIDNKEKVKEEVEREFVEDTNKGRKE